MCNVPTIKERSNNWIHNHRGAGMDELDLITNVELMPDWEKRGYTLPDVNAFREKMNEQDLPGESAVLGTRKPGDRKSRQKATKKTEARHKEMMDYCWSYEPILRGKNGEHIARKLSYEEYKEFTVATKKKSKREANTYWNRIDRRKSRHEGKAGCREIPDIFVDDAEEENREFFPEKADGTIDLDAYLAEDIYDDWDDWNDSYWELEDEEDLVYEEISQLKREISTYKDFLGEFNLNKLYQTWLAQNGKGVEGK